VHYVERSRLARAVRANQRVHSARRDLDIDAIHGLEAAEVLLQVVELQHRTPALHLDVEVERWHGTHSRGRRPAHTLEGVAQQTPDTLGHEYHDEDHA